MGKQAQISLTLTAQQVQDAVRQYVVSMVNPNDYDVRFTGMMPSPVTIIATKKRVRKAKDGPRERVQRVGRSIQEHIAAELLTPKVSA